MILASSAAHAATAVSNLAVGVLIIAVLLAVIVLSRTLRARIRQLEQAKVLIEAQEARLKLVLVHSDTELWRFSLRTQTIIRENPIEGLHDTDSTQLSLDEFFALIHSDDLPRLQAEIQQHLNRETAQLECVYRVRDSHGHIRWMRTSGRYMKENGEPFIIGTTISIHELKSQETALESANADLQARLIELEAARNKLIEAEKRRKLSLWGAGSEYFEADLSRRTLIRENQIQGLAVNNVDTLDAYWQHMHPDDVQLFADAFLGHVKGEKDYYDVCYRARRIDGSWCWVQTRARAVQWGDDGRAELISGTSFDITQLKEAELALKQLTTELEHRVEARTEEVHAALAELKRTQKQLVEREKLAALGDMVAGVSHEVNTPLGIAVTASSHLSRLSQSLQSKLDAQQLSKSSLQEFVQHTQSAAQLIEDNVRRASQLVRNFKQVAVDQASEQRRAFELGEYLRDVVNSLSPTLKRHAHQVAVEVHEPIAWDSYPGAIYQVVSNLILNAIAHAFDDQQVGRIVIAARIDGSQIVLSVGDNGRGMDSEQAQRAFEPFYTTKRGRGGSGLGLHIVFNLVTKVLAGEIELHTAPGDGARFVMRFKR